VLAFLKSNLNFLDSMHLCYCALEILLQHLIKRQCTLVFNSGVLLRWHSQSSKVQGLDPGFSQAFQVQRLDPGFSQVFQVEGLDPGFL
jgi:hypothetical protein